MPSDGPIEPGPIESGPIEPGPSPPGAAPPATPDAVWHRLHPLTLLFAIGARLYGMRGLVLPAGVAVIVSQRRSSGGWDDAWQRFEGWLFVPVGLLIVFELVQYFTLAYRFDRREIVITRGLFWKRERHIPYTRVQNIELVQHAPHRIAGVAVVRLDTGTGAGAEGELSVLSMDAVAELREAVRLGQRGVAVTDAEATLVAAPPPPGVLVALGPRELLLHGLLTGSGWVVIAAIAGAMWQFDLEDVGLERYLPSPPGVWNSLREATPTLALEIVALVSAALVVFRVLSALWSMTKHYGFTLTARGGELFQNYGLLTRVGRTIPRARIQKITVAEEPLMRLCSRATITIDTAASAKEKYQEQAAVEGSQVLVPIVPKADTPALVHDVYPTGADTPTLDRLDWQGVDPRAFRRLLRARLVLVAIITGASAPTAGWWALAIGSVAAVVLVLQAWLAVRFTAFAWSGDTIWFRSGAWTRQVSLVRAARTQVVSLEASPLDRRWGMAAIRVDTAGAATGGHHIRIRWLDAHTARGLYAELRRASAP